jgi:hypothetical protein
MAYEEWGSIRMYTIAPPPHGLVDQVAALGPVFLIPSRVFKA